MKATHIDIGKVYLVMNKEGRIVPALVLKKSENGSCLVSQIKPSNGQEKDVI